MSDFKKKKCDITEFTIVEAHKCKFWYGKMALDIVDLRLSPRFLVKMRIIHKKLVASSCRFLLQLCKSHMFRGTV